MYLKDFKDLLDYSNISTIDTTELLIKLRNKTVDVVRNALVFGQQQDDYQEL